MVHQMLALQTADATRFLGVDIFGWAVIAGLASVAAIFVSLVLHRIARWQRATVWIIESDNQLGPVTRFGVAIRNDGEPDLMIRKPAQIVIEQGSPAHGEPIALKLAKIGIQGFNPQHFPVPISTDVELTSFIQRSQLAGELWMGDCIEACSVRGVYYTTRGRRFRSPPFRVPVGEWLPADASERQIKPRP
jgi:hypothetical protein